VEEFLLAKLLALQELTTLLMDLDLLQTVGTVLEATSAQLMPRLQLKRFNFALKGTTVSQIL